MAMKRGREIYLKLNAHPKNDNIQNQTQSTPVLKAREVAGKAKHEAPELFDIYCYILQSHDELKHLTMNLEVFPTKALLNSDSPPLFISQQFKGTVILFIEVFLREHLEKLFW